MADPVITNYDTATVQMFNDEYVDGMLTFAGAATVLAGTILARDSVSLNFVPYAIGGVTNENGIPKAIITYPVTATGAGDEAVRVGITGEYRFSKSVVDADGDNSNITAAIRDQLRDYGIILTDTEQLLELDNQP